jgi:hypothetical protein
MMITIEQLMTEKEEEDIDVDDDNDEDHDGLSLRYKATLVEGAKQCNLSSGYVAFLESLPCVEAKELPPAYYATPAATIAPLFVGAAALLVGAAVVTLRGAT